MQQIFFLIFNEVCWGEKESVLNSFFSSIEGNSLEEIVWALFMFGLELEKLLIKSGNKKSCTNSVMIFNG